MVQGKIGAFESVAWHTIRQIGVKTQAIAEEVSVLLQAVQHKPEVVVRPQWYY
ncbi:DarT ssDNA thymidine ADP-ribosyltransferase family protein [Shewanella xiamenensis]